MQFATLDPTVRRLTGTQGEVLMADTVGFVSELPPELIAAFRATLLEARGADLLLHVIDAADPFHAERREEVLEVLQSIGADEIPVIEVYNKIDLVTADGQPSAASTVHDEQGKVRKAFVSALTGLGLEPLRQAIDEYLSGQRIRRWIHLDGKDARLRARLFELGAVDEEVIAADGSWDLHVDLPLSAAERLARLGGPEGAVVRARLLH